MLPGLTGWWLPTPARQVRKAAKKVIFFSGPATNRPQNVWNKRVIFFAKYATKLSKNTGFAVPKKVLLLVAKPLPPSEWPGH